VCFLFLVFLFFLSLRLFAKLGLRDRAQAVVIAAAMLVLYIPLGYYMDNAIYKRRQRRAQST